MEYLKTAEITCFEKYLGEEKYYLTINNTILKDLCLCIKEKYQDNDLTFCCKANINKETLVKLFNGDYIPSKHELLGMFMALELDLSEVFYFLDKANISLSYEDEGDCLFISSIATHKFDVNIFNQEAFVKNLYQIGTNVHPSKFFIKTTTIS